MKNANNGAIKLLVDVDKVFAGYDLEFSANEAPNAATAIGRSDIAAFIVEANQFMWPEQPAKDSYAIRIGRHFDTQVITVDLSKGFFPDAERIIDELEMMAMRHGAVRCGNDEETISTEVWARWERR